MRWCVGWQRERLSKKPSSDRRHDSQQRERERGERKVEREGGKRQKKRKTAEIKREKEREKNDGAEMPVRKTNEDADLRQNDKTSPRWD